MRSVVSLAGVIAFGLAAFAMPATASAQAASAKAESNDKRWQVTFDEETRYFSWSGTRGFPYDFASPVAGAAAFQPGHGTEVYVPLSFQVAARPNDDWKVEFLTRSGYVKAHQTTNGLDGSVSTWTDTSVSGTATYYGFNGFQPYTSLALNLPTGTAAIYGTAAFARMDPDIFDITVFGEGFNIAPTAGVNVPIGDSVLFGFSVGYTNRGDFYREGNLGIVPQPTTLMNPGDVLTFTPSLGVVIGDLTLQGSFSYSTETTTYANHVAQWKSGDRYTINGSASYDWTKMWNTTLSTAFSHTDKQQIQNAALALFLEPFDSNSEVFQVSLDNTIKVGALSFGPTVGYLHRDHNGYDSTDLAFVPAKDKWSAGAFATYQALENGTLKAKVQRLWISETDQPDKSAQNGVPLGFVVPGTFVPQIDGNAWVVMLGGTLTY